MRDWSEIYKSDIKNFQEFCKLRDTYNNILMDKDVKWEGNRTDIIEPIVGYLIGNTQYCPLCIAITDVQEFGCDACMWHLNTSNKSGLYCVNDTFLHDDLYNKDLQQTLEDRVRLMDQLIEEYYNLEETRP